MSKGVGDEHGAWAHYIYSAYPRRAENALPRELRQKLDELAKEGPHMTPAQLLEPHESRTIRAFLRSGEEDDEEVWAFWNLIYGGPEVAIDHETALAVERELLATDKRVRDVLAGWRPKALAWIKPGPGGDA